MEKQLNDWETALREEILSINVETEDQLLKLQQICEKIGFIKGIKFAVKTMEDIVNRYKSSVDKS